jgi:hypothetical protein
LPGSHLKLLLQTSVFSSFEGLDGGSFVILHKTTVAGDVGAEEGGELAVPFGFIVSPPACCCCR